VATGIASRVPEVPRGERASGGWLGRVGEGVAPLVSGDKADPTNPVWEREGFPKEMELPQLWHMKSGDFPLCSRTAPPNLSGKPSQPASPAFCQHCGAAAVRCAAVRCGALRCAAVALVGHVITTTQMGECHVRWNGIPSVVANLPLTSTPKTSPSTGVCIPVQLRRKVDGFIPE
jgi:hypothetical protein